MGLDWPGRSLLAAANPLDNVLRWEVAVLFAGFIIITVAWEWIMAFLSWFTLYTSGRKPLWIVRIKNEICALGVITLVLFALTPSLATICIDGTADMSSLSTDYPEHQCPDGQRLLFTKHMIHDTHILLFTVAIVHILYTCATLYLALYRMNQWASWEYASRHGQPLDPGPSHLAACLCPTAWQHVLRVLGWHSWSSALNHNMYSLLRVLFRLRIDEVARDGEHLPRQFNFLNILQQHMEYGFNESAEHSWAMTSVMAIFLALPSNLKGLYWMAGLSGICMWLASSKLQSVIIQLGATTYFDFKPILEDYIAEQRRRYRPLTRHATLDPALRKGPHHPLASFRTHLASMAHAAVALVSPAHGRSPSPPAPWEHPSPLTPASPAPHPQPQGLPNNPTTSTPQRGGQTTHAVPAFEPLASFKLGQAQGSQPATPQRWLSVRGDPHGTAGAKGPVAEGASCGPTRPGLTSEPLPPGLLLAGAATAAAWGGSTRAGESRAWAWASGGQKRNRVSPGPVAEGRAWSEGWDAGAGSGGPAAAAAAAAGGPGVAAPGVAQKRMLGTLPGPLPPAPPAHLTPHLPHLAATSLTNITSCC
ncbi:hypothetical protein V8C86DRAFT_65640 [Haematococcus lacustris]